MATGQMTSLPHQKLLGRDTGGGGPFIDEVADAIADHGSERVDNVALHFMRLRRRRERLRCEHRQRLQSETPLPWVARPAPASTNGRHRDIGCPTLPATSSSAPRSPGGRTRPSVSESRPPRSGQCRQCRALGRSLNRFSPTILGAVKPRSWRDGDG